MSMLHTYTIGGKEYAAVSLAQAFYAHRVCMGKRNEHVPKPLTPAEEARLRRTQYHVA